MGKVYGDTFRDDVREFDEKLKDGDDTWEAEGCYPESASFVRYLGRVLGGEKPDHALKSFSGYLF